VVRFAQGIWPYLLPLIKPRSDDRYRRYLNFAFRRPFGMAAYRDRTD
jgi:hypothetical protein